MRRNLVCLVFFVAIVWKIPLRALDVNLFHPAPGSGKLLTIELGSVGSHLELTPQLFLFYGYSVPTLDEYNKERVTVTHQFMSDISLSLSLWKRFQVAISFPIAWYQTGRIDVSQVIAPITIGDLRLHLKGVLWESQGAKVVNSPNPVLGIAIVSDISLPTGDLQNYLSPGNPIQTLYYNPTGDGTGSLSTAPGSYYKWQIGRNGLPSLRLVAAAHLRFRWFLLGLNFGGLFIQKDRSTENTLSHGFVYGIGAQFSLVENTKYKLFLLTEMFGLSRAPFIMESSPAEVLLALKAQYQRWNFFMGVGTGITEGYGTPKPRVFAGVSWTGDLIHKTGKVPNWPPPLLPNVETSVRVHQGRIEIQQNTRTEIQEKTYLDFDEDKVRPSDYPILNQVATFLVTHPEIKKIRIEGHTDAIGIQSYNLNLSQRRADFVRDYLIEKGVAKARLMAKGFGSKCPIAPNDTEAYQAKNRRVEFVILEIEGQPPNVSECTDEENDRKK